MAQQVSPAWFVVAFPAVWLAVTALLAHVSGWRNLATEFRSDDAPDGERFRFASGAIGPAAFPTRFNNCLSLVVGHIGFELSLWILFRVRAPTLFIPWTHVESVEERKLFFRNQVVIRVRNHWPTISIQGGAGQALLTAYRSQAGLGAKPLAPS